MADIRFDYSICGADGVCIEACPREDVLSWKKKEIKILGFWPRKKMVPVPITPDQCTKCRICVNMCPTGAITVDGYGKYSNNKILNTLIHLKNIMTNKKLRTQYIKLHTQVKNK